jgi:hypothetical protein
MAIMGSFESLVEGVNLCVSANELGESTSYGSL